MISTFVCQHCGRTCRCNPRVKDHKYCSRKECQQARMRTWKNKQYNSNPTYRKKNLESQLAWRKERPSHQYQNEYRKSHSEYVDRNRELQGKRNKKRQKHSVPMIVNGNSISLQHSGGMGYAIIQARKRKDCKWELVHSPNAVIIRGRDNLGPTK